MHELKSERFQRICIGSFGLVGNDLGLFRVLLDGGFLNGRQIVLDSRYDFVVLPPRLRHSLVILSKELPRVIHKPFVKNTSGRTCDR